MRRRHCSPRVFGDEQLDAALGVGLLGHWIGGGSGLGWRDHSGNQNHGVFVGAPQWSLGGPRNERSAVRTAAGTDQVNCGHAAMLTDLDVLSVSAWVLSTSFAAEQGIIEKVASNGSTGWGFVIDAGGTVTFFNLCSTTGASYTTAATLIANRWYHLVYTQTAKTGATGLIYLDGSLSTLGFTTSGAGAYATDAAANLSIAGRTLDTAGLVGIIDDVRIYNRVLRNTEVARLANPLFSPIGPTTHRRQVRAPALPPLSVPQAVNRASTY